MFESLLDVGAEPVEMSPFEGAVWAVGTRRPHGDAALQPPTTAGTTNPGAPPGPEPAADRDEPRDGAATFPAATDETAVPDADPEPTGDQALPNEAPAAAWGEASDAGRPVRLMLLEEPPLQPLPPDPAVTGARGSAPGPRITALAAATGAAVRRSPRQPTISVPQPTVVAGTLPEGLHLPGAGPHSPGGAAALPNQAGDGLWAATDTSSGHPRASVYEPEQGQITVWIRDDIPPTQEHGPAPARVAPTAVDASDANQAAAREQPASPAAPPATAEVPTAASTPSDPTPDRRPAAAAAPAPVDLADDDDFGPLVLPEPARRTWPRLRRPHRSPDPAAATPRTGGRPRRARLVGAALGLAVLVAAAAWWAVPRPATAPEAPRPAVSMVVWQGMALPVSASDGPTTFTATRVGGFARTDVGAALAAAHLSVRTDPVAGPAVFEPVLADQTVGARDRLATAVRDQSRTNPPAGAPGTLLGWRLDGDPGSDRVTAHLAVEHADGTRADYAVGLAWVAGDWRLDVPESGAFFPITDLSGGYAPFVEEASP